MFFFSFNLWCKLQIVIYFKSLKSWGSKSGAAKLGSFVGERRNWQEEEQKKSIQNQSPIKKHQEWNSWAQLCRCCADLAYNQSIWTLGFLLIRKTHDTNQLLIIWIGGGKRKPNPSTHPLTSTNYTISTNQEILQKALRLRLPMRFLRRNPV